MHHSRKPLFGSLDCLCSFLVNLHCLRCPRLTSCVLQTQPRFNYLHRRKRSDERLLISRPSSNSHYTRIRTNRTIPVSIYLEYSYIPTSTTNIHPVHLPNQPVSIYVHNASKTPTKSICQFSQLHGHHTPIRPSSDPETVYFEGQQIDPILLFITEEQGAAICTSASLADCCSPTAVPAKQSVSGHNSSFPVITYHFSLDSKGRWREYG